MVIGLDCAAPELVFDRWLDDLPNLKSLYQSGLHGLLRSCDPPITVPAWSVMMSSKSPGRLGVYGFRNRADYPLAQWKTLDCHRRARNLPANRVKRRNGNRFFNSGHDLPVHAPA